MNSQFENWISKSLQELGMPDDILDEWKPNAQLNSTADEVIESADPESRFLGGKLPEHLHILHLERNINTLVENVEKVERLTAEIHKYAFTGMQSNYLKYELRNQAEFLELHEAFSRQISDLKVKSDLADRLGWALIDIVQLYRCVKLGFSLIYEREFAERPDFGDSGNHSLSDIRRGIRTILRFLRKFSAEEQRSVFSISLLHQKSSDGYLVNSAWQEGERSAAHKGLKDRMLEFDFSKASAPWELLGGRIVRIGVSIVDRMSGLKGFKGTEAAAAQSSKFQDYWHVRLEDGGDGLPIYPGKRIVLGEVLVPSAPGARDSQAIRWVENPRLINFPVARPWKLSVEPRSMLGSDAEAQLEVRDIILHLDVVHRIRGLS